jgi:signal transduction histidine kinase
VLDRFPDRIGDLIVAVAVTFIVFVWTGLQAAVTAPEGALAEWLAWTVMAVSCAMLLFRTSRPLLTTVVTLACTIVYYPASAIDGPQLLTFVVALYTLAALGRTVSAIIVAGLAFFLLVVSEIASGFRNVSPAETMLLSGWFVAVVAFGSMMANYRAYRAEADVALSATRRRSVAEERLRIARELHDAVGHHLSLINVQANAALRKQRKNTGYDTAATLQVVADTSQHSLRELRALVGLLREADAAAPTDVGPSLDQLQSLADAARSSGLHIDLRVDGRGELPVAVDAAAYRVIQESLTNVIRHSGASRVAVEVTIGTSTLAVRVADDGSGGEPKAGNGLTGMRERAESLGGTFIAGPRTDGGFTVEATWPLEVPA